MKLNKVRFLETFALVTFPLALAVVGCTTTEDQQSKVNEHSATTYGQEYRAGQDTQIEPDGPGRDIASPPITATSTETETHQGGIMETQIFSLANKVNEQQRLDGDAPIVAQNSDLYGVNRQLPALQDSAIPTQGIVYFAANKHEVSKSDVEILKQHAAFLLENTTLVLYVDGFADNRGPAQRNYQLSIKRAQQVASLLISYGAPESRIKVNGYGESFPLTNETHWEENRRVELEYAPVGATDGLYATLR